VVLAVTSRVPVAVVTNYKPDRRPYEEALATLDLPAGEVLFVAGSRSDMVHRG